MNKIKIPKGWVFKYFQVEDGITKFVYEDNLGAEHIYINKEIEQNIPSYEELQERTSKAIELIKKYQDTCILDEEWSSIDKPLLEILKGVDKE